MKPRSLILLAASILAIAPLTATWGQSPTDQNPTTVKRQQAINAVSKLLKVPASELQVTSEVKIDANLTQFKVLHTKTGRISGISLNPNNSQVPIQQVQAILASKQGLDFKGKLERALADRVSSDQATGTSSIVIWTKASGAPPI